MPETVKINKEDGIVEVKSFDVVSQKNLESSIAKLRRIKNKTGINKILVNTIKQKRMPNITALFNLFSEFPSDLRTAMLATEKQATLGALQFTETLAFNRKINVKVFFEREAALEWLKK